MEYQDLILKINILEAENKNTKEKLSLSLTEFKILSLLIKNAEKELITTYIDLEEFISYSSIESTISRIRRKLKSINIQLNIKSICMVGYVIKKDTIRK